MARGSRNRRSRTVNTPSRAWVTRTPLTDLLHRELDVVRRSDPWADVSWKPEADRIAQVRFSRYLAQQYRYRQAVARRPARNVVSPRGLFAPTLGSLSFANPRRLLVCLRRKVRKEVLHALGFAGSGGGSRLLRRSPVYRGPDSQIHC